MRLWHVVDGGCADDGAVRAERLKQNRALFAGAAARASAPSASSAERRSRGSSTMITRLSSSRSRTTGRRVLRPRPAPRLGRADAGRPLRGQFAWHGVSCDRQGLEDARAPRSRALAEGGAVHVKQGPPGDPRRSEGRRLEKTARLLRTRRGDTCPLEKNWRGAPGWWSSRTRSTMRTPRLY